MEGSRVVKVVVSLVGLIGAAMAAFGFVTLTACCLGGIFADRSLGSDVSVAVSGHRWTRVVAVEERQLEADSDWCDELPAGAQVTRTSMKERKAIGGKKRLEQWCNFEALTWKETAEQEQTGRGLDSERAWPEVRDDGCEDEGCTRPGEKKERLVVELTEVGGTTVHECTVEEAQWVGLGDGDRATVLVGGLLGTLYCDRLTRSAGPVAAL